MSQTTVKAGLTARRLVENDEYAAFASRVVQSYARRVAIGDVDALPQLADLAATVDQAIARAVRGLRAKGYSWSEIGQRLGVSKQACQQRWGEA